MLHLNFTISNPWAKDNFKNLWNRNWAVSKRKVIELELCKYSKDIFSTKFNLTHRTDHAGLKIEISLLSYAAIFNFYDRRHWNYKNHNWEDYEES